MADAVAALVRRVAGPDVRVVLVGHSLGGYLVQHVALWHGDTVAGLVAIGCTSVTIRPPGSRMALLRLSALVFSACPPPVRRLLLMRAGRAAPAARRYVREVVARASCRPAAPERARRHGARHVVVPEAGRHAHMDNPACDPRRELQRLCVVPALVDDRDNERPDGGRRDDRGDRAVHP